VVYANYGRPGSKEDYFGALESNLTKAIVKKKG
jgi:hypothetical protein